MSALCRAQSCPEAAALGRLAKGPKSIDSNLAWGARSRRAVVARSRGPVLYGVTE